MVHIYHTVRRMLYLQGFPGCFALIARLLFHVHKVVTAQHPCVSL